MLVMSEGPVQKPVFKRTTTINIESATHGSFRFRKWMHKDSSGIRHLCNGPLEPREFAERLLAQQAVEPVLTQDELKGWTDAELTGLAVKWWHAVEGRRPPIAVDSIEDFRTAVRQRNDEHTESIECLAVGMSNLNPCLPELKSFERLTRDLARQSSVLDFGGQSAIHAIQRMLQRAELAQPYSKIADKLQTIHFANADRFAVALIQESIREARLLSMPAVSDLSKAGRRIQSDVWTSQADGGPSAADERALPGFRKHPGLKPHEGCSANPGVVRL